jgi:hypothetical protein
MKESWQIDLEARELQEEAALKKQEEELSCAFDLTRELEERFAEGGRWTGVEIDRIDQIFTEIYKEIACASAESDELNKRVSKLQDEFEERTCEE